MKETDQFDPKIDNLLLKLLFSSVFLSIVQ